jgi:transcriptional regulator with XRE-family HTH domain
MHEMNIDHKMIGNRIRTRRIELELTQEQAAELAGVSTSFIGHIERGEKIASVETLAALSGVLDMDLNYMILGVYRSDEIKHIKEEIQRILDKYE